MFKTRLISGIVLVLIALLTIITGGWVLWGTLLALSLIGVFELYRAVGLWKKENRSLTYTGLAGVVFYYLLLGFKADAYTMTGLILVLVVIMAVYVFSIPNTMQSRSWQPFLASFTWQSCFPTCIRPGMFRMVLSLYG